MASQQAVLIQKNRDQLVPIEIYQRVLDQLQPNRMGYAGVIDNSLLLDHCKVMAADEFKALQDEYKDVTILFHLSKGPAEGFDDRDKQPSVLSEDEDTQEPYVVGFAEGQFGKYAKPKGPRMEETLMMDELIMGHLNAYFEADKEPSIEKFMAYLKDPRIENDIKGAITGRGVVKLLANTGEICTFANNTQGKKYDWGEISISYDPPEQKAEAPKRRGFGQRMPKASEPSPSPAEAAPQLPPPPGETVLPDKKEEEPKKEEEVKTAASSKFPPKAGHAWVKPISGQSKAFYKSWYEKAIGFVPQHGKEPYPMGWKAHPAVCVPFEKVPDRSLFAETNQPYSKIAEAITKGAAKNVEAQHIQSSVVPATQLTAFHKTFMERADIKAYNQGVKAPPSLDEVKAWEDKEATWFEKTKIPVMSTLGWPPAARKELHNNYPHLAELRSAALTHELVKKMSAGEQKKTEETVQQPQQQKRSFGQRKQA